MKHEGSHPTRDRILRAATDLMWQHGYAKTSPAHVMKKSGVGQGSFYHHFPDKRSLGLAVIRDIVDRTNASLEEIFGNGAGPMQRVRLWLQAARHQYRPPCDRGCPLGRLGIEMANEDPGFRDALAPGFEAIRERLTASLREAAGSGQLDPSVDPQLLAELLLAGVEGAILVAHCAHDALPLDRSFRQLEELLDRFERPTVVVQAGTADP